MKQSLCQTSIPDPDLSNSINNTADGDESNSMDIELPSAEEDIVDVLDCSVTCTGYVSDDGSIKENLEITSAILKALGIW